MKIKFRTAASVLSEFHFEISDFKSEFSVPGRSEDKVTMLVTVGNL